MSAGAPSLEPPCVCVCVFYMCILSPPIILNKKFEKLNGSFCSNRFLIIVSMVLLFSCVTSFFLSSRSIYFCDLF